MDRPNFRMLATAAVAGAMLACGSDTRAQSSSEGRVRITDQTPSASKAVQAQPAGFHGRHVHGQYQDVTGTAYGPAAYGYDASCPPGHGHFGHRHGHPHLHGIFSEHYCKRSPGYGYSVPAKVPLFRRGVQYSTTFTPALYGAGLTYAAAYPQVYQPTDTTQLGFYYQHVPFWQPNPGMLPPRPVPAQWHVVAPTAPGSVLGLPDDAVIVGGQVIDGSLIETAPANGVGPTPLADPALPPGPAPVPAVEGAPGELPPVPPQPLDSAASNHIRRAGFEQ